MISIIAAVAQNGVIGRENQLLWHIPEDLKHFKAITTEHTVIMGRRTFESLGRPLPNRKNIVITRQLAVSSQQSAVFVNSLAEAVAMTNPNEEAFIIGGGEIYRQAIELAEKLYITWVEGNWKGDTFFPEIDPAAWRETSREAHEGFVFTEYERV